MALLIPLGALALISLVLVGRLRRRTPGCPRCS